MSETTGPKTIIATETGTPTGTLSSSVLTGSTNLPQTGVISTSISGSNTSPLVFSNPTSSSRYRSHRRSRLGLIVGGIVAVFALILLFVLLVLVLLKRRASRRESRLRAAASEIDPTSTPLDHVDTREELGRHVSVNDNGLRPEMPRPTVNSSSQIIPPSNCDLKRARTNYTVHSSIHDDRIHLPSEYTSDTNHQAGGQFQSNSSNDLITTNGAITEEMTDTPTYIPGQSRNETHLHWQTDSTRISTNFDYAPPAYDSLPSRV